MSNDAKNDIQKIFKDAPDEIQTLVNELIKLENENKYLKKPRIKDDLIEIVKGVIK